jgi:DNA-binding MarR family transcriptional regulator
MKAAAPQITARKPPGTMAKRKTAPPENIEQIDTSLVESFIGYSTRRASLAIVETFMQRMTVHELRPVNFTLLALIAGNPGIMSSQLCALLKIQSSNLVAMVKQLHGRGLIERQPHQNDVRALGLHLTATGRSFMKKAQATALAAGLEATARLTDEERATLTRLLRKIYQ